jgi:hypothetical protein
MGYVVFMIMNLPFSLRPIVMSFPDCMKFSKVGRAGVKYVCICLRRQTKILTFSLRFSHPWKSIRLAKTKFPCRNLLLQTPPRCRASRWPRVWCSRALSYCGRARWEETARPGVLSPGEGRQPKRLTVVLQFKGHQTSLKALFFLSF